MKALLKRMKWVECGLMVCLTILLLGVPVSSNAKDGPPIKIGILGPMKYTLGEHMWVSAVMAAEEINASGGVNVNGVNRKIELVKKDGNSAVSLVDALNAFKSLITFDKVDFVVGGHRSESVLAMMDTMAKYKMVFINTGAGHSKIMERVGEDYDKYKYMFRTQSNTRRVTLYVALNSANAAADALRKNLGIEKPKVAIIIEKTLAGNGMTMAGKAVLPKMGMEVIGEWRPSAKATDMTAELTAVRASGAQIIYNFFPGPAGTALSRGWGELQIPAVLAGMNGQAQRKMHWENTGGMCNYEVTVGPIGRCKITERTIPYFDGFAKRLGDFPLYNAPATYDGIFVLKEAIERAGTIESDVVVSAMEKTDYRGAIGRIVFYQKGHKTPHDYIMGPGYVTWVGSQWQDGKFIPVSPNGKIALGDKRWEGFRYAGTVDYKLPQWVIKHWKKK